MPGPPGAFPIFQGCSATGGRECGGRFSLPFLRLIPQPGPRLGLNARVSHLVDTTLGSQSLRSVGRAVGEDIRDLEVKTLQDVRGLHLPREIEVRLEMQ